MNDHLIVQPSVGKRIAFATWARRNHVPRRSSTVFLVPCGIEVPGTLLVGAQVSGRPPAQAATRQRVRKEIGPISEPAPPVPQSTDQSPEFVPPHTPWLADGSDVSSDLDKEE